MVKSVEKRLDEYDERGQELFRNGNVTLCGQDKDHSQCMDDNRYSTSSDEQRTTAFYGHYYFCSKSKLFQVPDRIWNNRIGEKF
jgi:hypothetical protein